jgi:hypothetical protein
MGSKIERVVLVFIIVATVIGYLLINKKYNTEAEVDNSQRSTELNDFTEYDINRTNLMATLTAQQAFKLNEVWFLSYPIVTTDKIAYVKSKRALSKKGIVEFIDNVKTLRRDGKQYFSNKVFYKVRSKEIVTPGEFLVIKEFQKMRGTSMVYDTDAEATRAKNVNATFKIKNGEN